MTQPSTATPQIADNSRESVTGSCAEAQFPSSTGVDWRRVKGYKAACNIKKNPSWIWQHGYRLWNEDEHEILALQKMSSRNRQTSIPKGPYIPDHACDFCGSHSGLNLNWIQQGL